MHHLRAGGVSVLVEGSQILHWGADLGEDADDVLGGTLVTLEELDPSPPTAVRHRLTVTAAPSPRSDG